MGDEKEESKRSPSEDESNSAVPKREWKFTQWFRKSPNDGAEGVVEDAFDISAVEFDTPGDYLATGDNSGNIVVLRNDPRQAKMKDELVRFVFHCEFQSHFQEFDYVTSTPTSERINNIKWGPRTNNSLFLLTTNCKHIKLWKITEREPFRYVNCNFSFNQDSQMSDPGIHVQLPRVNQVNEAITELKVPRIIKDEKCAITSLKKWYPYEGHSPTINQLGVSPDMQNFISADFFKVNLWDFFRQDTCYTIADFLPKDGSPPKEVITCLDYHPNSSHLFLHGSNLGKIRICDMRQKALADTHAKCFISVHNPQLSAGSPMVAVAQMGEEEQASLFDEVTSGVAAAKFSNGGRYIISRDYMSVKIWDARYEKRPFERLYTQEFLRERLFELYQNELLSDAFSLGLSSQGDIVTGSYSNFFHLFELRNRRDVFIQASREPQTISPIHKHIRKRQVAYAHPGYNATLKKKRGFGLGMFGGNSNRNKKSSRSSPSRKTSQNAAAPAVKDEYPIKMDFERIEFDKKILDCAWHPKTDAVAVTGQNSLFIYSK